MSGGGQGWGALYSDVQWVMVTWGPPNRMTDTCENITFPQIRWRAVIKYEVHMIDNFQTYSRTFGSISDEYLCKQSNIWHHEITELHALRKQENASDSIENLRASGASL